MFYYSIGGAKQWFGIFNSLTQNIGNCPVVSCYLQPADFIVSIVSIGPVNNQLEINCQTLCTNV